jgi:type IV pilus assembly protein PilA
MKTTKNHAFTVLEIMVIVIIIGLLAAMAIPTMINIRTKSQDTAVLNNIKQLSGAAQQYFMENGVSQCVLTDLVPSYFNDLKSVAGETYPAVYEQNIPITVTNIGGSRSMTYDR